MPSWVIVGASRGIGYQYVKTLSQDSSNSVFAIVRTPSTTQAKVDADGLKNVRVIEGDLESAASLNAAAEQVSSFTDGVVDHLVINGAYISTDTLFIDPEGFVGKEDFFVSELNKSLVTNVAGVLFSVNAFIKQLRNSTIKKVVVISSAVGDIEVNVKTEMANGLPYAISKAGLNLLVAKLAIAYKDEGIIFLALNPGMVLSMVDSPDNIPPPLASVLDTLSASMRKLHPDFKGPIMPEESVEKQLKVIDGLTIEQTGTFVGHHGDRRMG